MRARLRRTFNSRGRPKSHKFTWACTRWQLVTRFAREHHFK
jgi:hypothetical protein